MITLLKKRGVRTRNVFLVPNGVNPKYFHPIDKTMCRSKLNLDDAPFYFCFVGNLAPWQGIDKAIAAFAKLLNEKPGLDAKLLIAGTGPSRKELEKLASELKLEKKIVFLGSIAHELVPYVICASDVCIAPFGYWRNMKMGVSPLKLFEYLSCGRPVVVSSIPGTEIVKQLDAGIVVKPDDIEELKDAFGKAIQTFSYFEQREDVISHSVAETQSWQARVNDIIEIVWDLVNE
jgi:glycosyltransferase involved in cell wall biosynthesis